jgi:hypothetical protein
LRNFIKCGDFLSASISAESPTAGRQLCLFVEFRRYASRSKENDRLLVEVSQFRVTGPTPRDHANSGSRKALCGSAGRQLGLACNGRVGKKARPAAGPERLYDVDCFLSHGANLHRGQSTRDPTPSADDRTALESRFFRRVADFTRMRARPSRRNSSPARRIGVSGR